MPKRIKSLLNGLAHQFSKIFQAGRRLFRAIKKFLEKKFVSLPSFKQAKHFLKVLSKKERNFFLICFFCFLASLSFLCVQLYYKKTYVQPARGGHFSEGVVGQPRFINSVLASTDVDRDLIELLLSGLMRYDGSGNIVPDLARDYEIKEQGRIYEVSLKDNIFWHDGKKVTADDVVFTIKTIQNEEYKSPEIANWLGVEIEKISSSKVSFTLKNPYFPFLERLTLKIIPKHIFEQIPAENFPLASFNLEPIGSGPFKFKELKHNKAGKIESLILIRNENYFEKLPYLGEISFQFFDNEEGLISADQKRIIDGLVISNPETFGLFKRQGFNSYNISLPRYFAVFLNQEKAKLLEKKEVRQALNLAINKQALLEEAVNGEGKITYSPILPEIYGFNSPLTISEFNLDQAKELLKKAGLVQKDGKFINPKKTFQFTFTKDLREGAKGEEVEMLQKCLSLFPDIYPEAKVTGYFGESTEKAVIAFQEKYKNEILEPWGFEKGTGLVAKTTREKLNEVCNQPSKDVPAVKFSLKTINQPLLTNTAQNLKNQWEALGIEIEVETFDFNSLTKDIIKPRDYEMLLFGQALNIIPDPFAFWHSSKTKDPGVNLSLYESKEADKFLKEAREALNFQDFQKNLEEFQNILLEDTPAILLYNPDFVYLVSNRIKGIDLKIIVDPSKRFVDAENWYIKTQRTFK